MSELPQEFIQAFERLSRDYAGQVGSDIEEISEQWEKVAMHWETDAVSILLSLVHKLKGTGSTFGLPMITAIARELESQLAAINAVPSGRQRRQVDETIGKFLHLGPKSDNDSER